jgi:hypothetical protein
LNVLDSKSGAIVARTMTTVVAAVRLEPSRPLRLTGVVPLMQSAAQYISVPEGAGAIAIELEVVRGSLGALILPSHGMMREYYGHVWPQGGRTFTAGHYSLVLPAPAPGVWTVTLMNDSASREQDRSLVSTTDAAYAVSIRLLSASVEVQRVLGDRAVVRVVNGGAPLGETALDTAAGTLRTVEGTTMANGLPNQFDIDVPAGAHTLALHVSGSNDAARLELYLYDCTSGECFSYDFTVPAAREQSLVVRDPTPGRWILAVNGAPFPSTRTRFVVDEIVAGAAHRQLSAATELRSAGARWSATVDLPRDRWHRDGTTSIVLVELVDAATERGDVMHPWENRRGLTNFADRPAAIAKAVLRLR